MPPFISLIGRRFGRLVVVDQGQSRDQRTRWRCRCDCGNEIVVRQDHLRDAHCRSCGCLHRDSMHASATHGMSQSAEYAAWKRAQGRCVNWRNKRYKDYGGRGITVCAAWANSFEQFYRDVGPRPSPAHSLDRWPNNDGDYEPGNVRWATAEEQANNTRRNRVVLLDGDIPMTVAQVARAMEISWSTAKRMYGHLLCNPSRKDTPNGSHCGTN